MTAARWFVDDDVGYEDWLADHADGYVLNALARPTVSYLVLHRAGCRVINRSLAGGRHWTHGPNGSGQ